MISVNNKLILEPYKGTKKLKAKGVSSGFAVVEQRTNLVGLKLLADARFEKGPSSLIQMDSSKQITQGTFLEKGSYVFFREETLYSQPHFTNAFECDVMDEPFIIADFESVIMIKEAK